MKLRLILFIFQAYVLINTSQAQNSWQRAQQVKQATIQVLHVDAPPFIYQKGGTPRGIECEIMQAFARYIKKEHHIDINLQFIEMSDFGQMYQRVKTGKSGVFGASSFSITEERKDEIHFSPPYMSDIEVLISHRSVPIARDLTEFKNIFDQRQAITLPNTTFEQNLFNLREYLPNLSIQQLDLYSQICPTVAENPNTFAYVQLASYFTALKKGLAIGRQQLFKVVKPGRAVVYPLNSDWQEPLEEFFLSPEFKPFVNQVIRKYFGQEVKELVWNVADTSRSDRNKDILMLTKEKEIQKLQLDRKELTIQRQNFYRNSLIIGILIISIFTFLLFNRYQLKQRSNRLLTQKNEEILEQRNQLYAKTEELRQQQEEILSQRDFIEKRNRELDQRNNQIYNSIKAALVIQRAMLPYDSRMQEGLHEFFVVYHPKDIVSGDFYWLQQIADTVLIAVADCTGHGVPGALMAMLGQALLDKIVLQGKETDPSRILRRLHEEVQYALKQEENKNNYGMDIGLAAIEPIQDGRFRIVYAGAKRSLYFIPNYAPDLAEIPGDRKSIGGWQNEIDDFHNQEILLGKNSLIYLSSDGYVDQNDFNRKRFGEKRLKAILEDTASLKLHEQKKALEQALAQHKQGTTQRDDILLLGFRL